MRTFLQLLAMMVSQIFNSPFAHGLGHKSRPEVGVIELFYAIKAYVKCTVGSENVIQPELVIAYTHILLSRLFSVPSVCFQFSFVFPVWFTGFISLVLPWMFQWQGPALTSNAHLSFDILSKCLRRDHLGRSPPPKITRLYLYTTAHW